MKAAETGFMEMVGSKLGLTGQRGFQQESQEGKGKEEQAGQRAKTGVLEATAER